MGRFIKYAAWVLAVGIACICSSQTTVVSAISDKIWVGTPVVKVNEVSETSFPYGRTSCSVEVLPISIEGWSELRDACVYGGEGRPQLARYIGSTGSYLYAIKFPLDAKFVPIRDMCLNAAHCAYGQAEDVLIMQVQQQYGPSTALIGDFTKYLRRFTDDGTYFRLEYSGAPNYISLGSRIPKTNAVAVSQNGKWALVELESYGFVRVNLKTGDYKRVVAPGAQYGYGVDPSFELAITDDGTKIAVAGWRASIWVYEVDDECGDRLTDATSLYFSPYVYACGGATIDVYGLLPGFMAAYVPRFSSDGTRLTTYVQQNQQIKKVTLAPTAFKTTTQPVHAYIAFGDSFTSGEGELLDSFYLPTTNTNENHCHVSTRSYPYLVGAAWDESTINKACSGSRIANVREASRQSTARSPVESPRYISIGVGGNDVDLMGKLKTCLGPGTCEWASAERRQTTLDEIRAMFPKILKLIGEVRGDYPGAAIGLVGYPSVVNGTPGASCGALVSALLSVEERQYMDESVRYLNKVIKAATNYAGITYINTEDALLGERLCDVNERAINSFRFGGDIAPFSLLGNVKIIGAESFHPTPRGHEMIAAAIQSSTGGIWWKGTGCNECLFSESQLAASSYWYGGASEAPEVKQRAEPFLSTTDVTRGAKLSLSFPSGSFAPGSLVRFEFHSTPQKLAEYTAKEDGSLDGNITVPDNDGYHTIHAYGQSFSGEAMDIYETIAIRGEAEVGAESLGELSTTPTIARSDEVMNQSQGENIQSVLGSVKGATITNPFITTANAAPLIKPALSGPSRDSVKIIAIFSAGMIGGGLLASTSIAMFKNWKKRRGG